MNFEPWMMVFSLLFGLIVGSFLNVLIIRYGSTESALTGRSRCPNCRRQLTTWELVPLVSFVLLGGRCRSCKKRISWQYPFVELVTALGTAMIVSLSFSTVVTIMWLVVLWTAIAIFFIDLKTMIIPDIATLILVVCGFVLLATSTDYPLSNAGWGVVAGGGLPLLVIIATKGRGMGLGDVKLGAALGLLLGWPLILIGLFFSVMIGAIVGGGLVALKVLSMKSAIPFGPFLLLGAFLAMLWGESVLRWYGF